MYRKWKYLTCMLMVLGLFGTSVIAADSGLVGWWKFDETSGIIAHDSSGYNNDGTLYGDPQWGGGALEFDGVDDYVDCRNDASLNITGEVTVAAWIKLTGPAPDRKIAGNQDGITGGYKFGVYSNLLEFEIRTSGNMAVLNRNVGGGTILEQDVYYHVAGVYSQGNYIKTYVNGVLDREQPTTAVLGTSTGAFKIGREPFSDLYFWLGLMDDVQVYNRALTQGEIWALARGDENPFASNPDPVDGARYEDTWVTLSWEPGSYAVSHDVYFGDNFSHVKDGTGGTFRGNMGLDTTLYIAGFPGYPYPNGLVLGTTYYWRIDEVNDLDPNSPWRGDVWRFTVPPKTAYDPVPTDGSMFIGEDVTLSWKAGMRAILHHVYFGENWNEVDAGTGETYKGLVGTTTYTPDLLELDKTYYWRIDEFDGTATHKGNVWGFTILQKKDYIFDGGIPVQLGKPTGNQSVLIIFVRASDDNTTNLANLRTSEEAEFTNEVANFYRESSFGQLSFTFTGAPSSLWYQLSKTYDDYMWTQADINAEPVGSPKRQEAIDNEDTVQDFYGFFAEALQEAQDDNFNVKNHDQIVVVIIGPFHRGTSYPPANFTLKDSNNNNFQVTLPVVVVSTNRGWSRSAHEIGHAICDFEDFYYSTSLRPGYWDIMDCTDCGSQTTGWHKDIIAQWYSDAAHSYKLKTISRPKGMDRKTDTTILIPYETENAPANSVQSLRLDVAPQHYYYVENRQSLAGQTGSQNLPADAVIVTDALDSWDKVNTNRDPVLLISPYSGLKSGDTFTDQAYGNLKIEVSGTAPNLQVKTTWGPDPYIDLSIEPWFAPPYESPDIWIDSPVNGWDTYEHNDNKQNPLVPGHPIRNGDRPLINENNYVYARISNKGTKEATNVVVSFYVSEPQGMGQKDTTWSLFGKDTIPKISAESSEITDPISWAPRSSTHTCLKVQIDHIPGELNANNNYAYENVSDFNTKSSSPWEVVKSEIRIENPTDTYQTIRLEMLNLPQDWTGWVSERFISLPPDGSRFIQYGIDPGLGGEMDIGSQVDVHIVGYMCLNTKEIELGGVTSAIHLVQSSEVFLGVEEVISVNNIAYFQAYVSVLPQQANLAVALEVTEEVTLNNSIVSSKTDTNGEAVFFIGDLIQDGKLLPLQPGNRYIFQAHLYGSSSIDSGCSPEIIVEALP